MNKILISVLFFSIHIVYTKKFNMQNSAPDGDFKYLGVTYNVYKYNPSKKLLHGDFRAVLNTGDRVIVKALEPNIKGVERLSKIREEPIFNRLRGSYAKKNGVLYYVFMEQLAD